MMLQNLAVVLMVIHASYAKHFHGGSMSWRPINDGRQIELKYRVGFKLEHSEPGFDQCADTAIANRSPLRGSGYLECDKCDEHGDDHERRLYWVCDANDHDLDSSVGGDVVVYDAPRLPSGETQFEISFESCCWINLVSPDTGSGARGWKMMTQVNMQYRPDIDGINSSPVTAPIPVEKFRGGCVYNLRIAVSDPDNDLVTCRQQKPNECPTEVGKDRACGTKTKGLTINSDCTLVFKTTPGEADTVGYYAANVMIRDCPNKKCKKPYSKVPLLFLLHVADSNQNCMAKPNIIIPPSCNTVSPGDTFEIEIKAEAGAPSLPISKIFSYKPMEMTESPMMSVPGNDNQKYVRYTWTPTSSDVGIHNLCFSAHDSEGYTSGYLCTFLKVTTSPPVTVDKYSSTPAEGAEHILEIAEPWLIQFSGEIERPKTNAFIRIVDMKENEALYTLNARNNNGDLTYTGSTIQFHPIEDRFPLILEGDSRPFRIELDDGVAVPVDGGCPTAAAQWEFSLKSEGDNILPREMCSEDSPKKDVGQCEKVIRELTTDPYGNPKATGKYLCCSCIEPMYSPAVGAPAPPARPDSVKWRL